MGVNPLAGPVRRVYEHGPLSRVRGCWCPWHTHLLHVRSRLDPIIDSAHASRRPGRAYYNFSGCWAGLNPGGQGARTTWLATATGGAIAFPRRMNRPADYPYAFSFPPAQDRPVARLRWRAHPAMRARRSDVSFRVPGKPSPTCLTMYCLFSLPTWRSSSSPSYLCGIGPLTCVSSLLSTHRLRSSFLTLMISMPRLFMHRQRGDFCGMFRRRSCWPRARASLVLLTLPRPSVLACVTISG